MQNRGSFRPTQMRSVKCSCDGLINQLIDNQYSRLAPFTRDTREAEHGVSDFLTAPNTKGKVNQVNFKPSILHNLMNAKYSNILKTILKIINAGWV